RAGSLSMSTDRGRRDILIIILLLIAVSLLHYSTGHGGYQIHYLHQRLYYIPIVLAAFRLGLRGAIVTAMVSSFLYGPRLLLYVGPIPHELSDSFYELIMFNIVGWVTGLLSEQVRRAQKAAQASNDQLFQTNHSLHDRNQALERLQRYLDNILHSIATGVVTFNQQGQVLMANAEARRIFAVDGEHSEAVLDQHLASDAHLATLLRDLVGSERGFYEELAWKDLAGQPKRLRIRGSMMPPLGDEPRGFLLVVEDVTALHTLAEQVNRSERMNALGQMVAGLMHEIRNPLGVISTTSQLLLEDLPPGSELSEGIGIIRDEASRLNRNLNLFLDFARPRSVHQKVIQLEKLIEDLMVLFRPMLKDQGIQPTVCVDPSLKEMVIDPDLLRQIMVNLILNALQAMPKGGRLSIGAQPVGERLRLTVSDTGIGISEDALGRIFDPFFTTKETGTGIGLSVVHRLVDDMGGLITLHSQKGQGATFDIFLPLVSGGDPSHG
ncbi:MAG: two-component system sensor histidine kinase NtrB, partial [Bacillota bacterium]